MNEPIFCKHGRDAMICPTCEDEWEQGREARKKEARAALAQPEEEDGDAIIIAYHEATIKRLEKRIVELELALCQKHFVQTTPEQEPVMFNGLTLAETDESASVMGLTPPQRKPLTEEQQVDCLVKSGCIGNVKMSFESGPYDITRPSINASRLIEQVEAAHGIGVPK
jgi:uncharacterized protein YceH (UPF0502 family)